MVFTKERHLQGKPTVCALTADAALAIAMIARIGPKDAAGHFHLIWKRIGPRRTEELAAAAIAYLDAHTATILYDV